MMKIVIAGLLGAIALFIWSFVSWMLLPFHGDSLHNLPNADAVAEVLRANDTPSGVYHYPGFKMNASGAMAPQSEQVEWFKRHEDKPTITMMVYQDPRIEPMAAGQFIKGFLTNLLAALVAAFLLKLAAPALSQYRRRVLFVTLLGVFLAVAVKLEDWVWWSQTAEFALPGIFDAVIGWFAAGLLIAALVKQPVMIGRE